MRRAVYKADIPVDDQPHTVPLSAGAPILHVDAFRLSDVRLWAEVDLTQVGADARTFRVYRSGQQIDDLGRHVGTTVVAGEALHLYEVTR